MTSVADQKAQDEAARRKEQARAHRAKSILEDPLVQEAFAHLEDAIDRTWKTSPEKEIRENAWHIYQMYRNFRSGFERLLTTGQMAERQLFDLSAEREKRGAVASLFGRLSIK